MENILEIKNLNMFFGEHQALFDVNLNLEKGKMHALVGESGCGKSTLAKTIMKLMSNNSGEIKLNGQEYSKIKNSDFYKKIQIIFQNPYSSLNPKMKIGEILRESLEINTNLSKKEIKKILEEKISQVGLDKECLNKYPHEFSGGQRQRIAIARALMLDPEIIIADEPVSALDVSIQAQIINLLKSLKNNLNLTIIFISHDLSVIRYISDKIAVMYLGEIIEYGRTEEIFKNPKHPYTKALLSSVPELSTNRIEKEIINIKGELPSAENLPKGCKFHTRCPYVMEKCKNSSPINVDFSQTHKCKCFLYPEENENSVI
jgi:oligopeptide/dipeptide ABC transporter ATP-binding protein